ncbi:hypothetical protein FOXB_15751 [Fusarium oxysporum f. sp. conglutinans Fo5176]|uniref:Uncharacterized protein n=1 Tax=Fusarium oxysporum (strain Fo5176) TaxID=660025 RepID=F9GAR9_FUSOF|nr:hypothetical protein FOXB_15751 [Fusarium oxysporum f. sp. conglutinans Fo5176]
MSCSQRRSNLIGYRGERTNLAYKKADSVKSTLHPGNNQLY